MDKNQVEWFITRLTGQPDSVVDWRVIHDKDKGEGAHNLRGSINELWAPLTNYNNLGWGVFCNINQLDGQGFNLNNVSTVRAHFADLDNTLTSHAMYEKAVQEGACIAVQSSPGKYHVYWLMNPYNDNNRFTTIQRKIVQTYDGDKQIVDATRVMRVPGFYHHKQEPTLVTGWDLPSVGNRYTVEGMETFLQHVNIIQHVSSRKELGDPELQAPSLEWLLLAMNTTDPNHMSREEWLSFSAAIKQAGWNHTDEATLRIHWLNWCAKYEHNDNSENEKLWNSIKDSEVGWKTIRARTPVKAYEAFGFKEAPTVPVPQQTPTVEVAITADTGVNNFGEILSEHEQAEYFKNCYFITQSSRIVDSNGRFMSSTAFNGRYGGKQFIITSTGKLTDEPWKAATRSTLWNIPKVDHTRFLPMEKPFSIIEDAMQRDGLNVYIPAKIDAVEGDVSLWLDLLTRILPDENDRRMFTDYLAHCVKYPGHKIPYAPLLQSAEGIGKSVFFEVMQHALGDMYVYSPKAPELVKSGSTFNAWQKGKLLIVVNEIKIDERRELIEILKPMITDSRVEIQSKGVDQEMEDNAANWLFFSNYKDAIPINKDSRRYAIFFSALQSAADIEAAGMDKYYFDRLFDWLRKGKGLQSITHWLLNYPIECGKLPVRAPKTSCYNEALTISRSPMEVLVAEAVSDGLCGFKGDYVSSIAVLRRCKGNGIRNANARSVQSCLETMGYVRLGRGLRSYVQEDLDNRSDIYGLRSNMALDGYGAAQGYE